MTRAEAVNDCRFYPTDKVSYVSLVLFLDLCIDASLPGGLVQLPLGHLGRRELAFRLGTEYENVQAQYRVTQ